MTPKEKVKELERKYWDYCGSDWKECALIAVDEILGEYVGIMDGRTEYFWKQVEEEINKL